MQFTLISLLAISGQLLSISLAAPVASPQQGGMVGGSGAPMIGNPNSLQQLQGPPPSPAGPAIARPPTPNQNPSQPQQMPPSQAPQQRQQPGPAQAVPNGVPNQPLPDLWREPAGIPALLRPAARPW